MKKKTKTENTTVLPFTKSNRKIVERDNIDTHTHIYMTTYPPGLA